jgi:thiol-disulfide isomerase/thioredoxin
MERMLTSVRVRTLAAIFFAFVFLTFAGGCSSDVQSESAAEPGAAEADGTAALPKTATPPAPQDSSAQPEAGRSAQAAPDFELYDLDGRVVHLSDFAGKSVLLNFWATWCAPCKAELPDLVEVQRQYGGDGFVIVGISLDRIGPAKVREFVRSAGLNYPILMGNGDVVAAYGNFQMIPTSFLLNASHEKVKQYTGLVTKAQLVRDLEGLP